MWTNFIKVWGVLISLAECEDQFHQRSPDLTYKYYKYWSPIETLHYPKITQVAKFLILKFDNIFTVLRFCQKTGKFFSEFRCTKIWQLFFHSATNCVMAPTKCKKILSWSNQNFYNYLIFVPLNFITHSFSYTHKNTWQRFLARDYVDLENFSIFQYITNTFFPFK